MPGTSVESIPDIEHRYVETNSVRLHVVQAGPQDGPVAILLHGFPEFWYGWRHQIGPLAQAGFRVWAPDQRGYNLSDKPKGIAAYQLDELSKDVLGLITAAGRKKVFLVGHDWGAAVAWWVAIHYPQRLEKLCILNVPHPAVMSRMLRRSPAQLRKSWYIFFFQIPALPEAILRANDWERAVEMLTRSSKPGTFIKTDLEQYRRAWWQKGAMTSMINWYRALMRFQPSPPADLRVHVPTLMLWGVNDIALGREMAAPSIELCDDGRLVFFETATHWVQHDEAAHVNRLLVEMLPIV